MLRILHVTPYSAGAWAYGGIPRLVHTLTRGLARRGHDVTVCTTDACDGSRRLPKRETTGTRFRAWPPSRTADNVELRVFPNLSNPLAYHLQLFLPLGFTTYLSEHAGSFDVAHLHACRNVPGAMAAYYLGRAGVPYVLSPNGTAPRIERRQFAKRIFDALMGHRVVNGAARVVAVSAAEQRQFQALGLNPAAVRQVPNPVDLDEFKAQVPRGRFRARFKLPDASNAPVVLFLGKLTPRKRVDVLARAFAQLGRRDARLVIAGNDMGSGHAIRALIQELGIGARATLTGLLRGSERLEALTDADVVVYPSEDEVFGLVPLEAILAGTPVIVAGDSGCGEIINRIGGGHVAPAGDVAALARAIDLMLAAPSSWRTATVPAADRIRAAYGDATVCAAIEQIYGEVVAAS